MSILKCPENYGEGALFGYGRAVLRHFASQDMAAITYMVKYIMHPFSTF